MLVNLGAVSFGYDDNLILTDITCAINEGERIGLIGANGEGKTTLIRLILGELDAVSGTISQKNGVRIGYLEQNGGYQSGATVYDEMLSVFTEERNALVRLDELSTQMSACEYGSHDYIVLSAKLESLHKYISAHDCYNVEVKIKTVLNGMGFEKTYDQIVDTMSGGEKTRLKLARLLLEEPDLLILDEPTNHLDIQTLFWLEEYLSTFKGAIFIVSHDRFFLDQLVTKVYEIEDKKLTCFVGNYTKYKVLKQAKVEREQKEYEKQQEEIAKLQDYVDRNLVRASTTKMAQSRRTKLEKMEVLEKPYTPPKPPRFSFTYELPPYEQVLKLQNFNLSIGGKTLLTDSSLVVTRGQKVAIVGENGTGKSTLLKAIIQNQDPHIEIGRFVHLACYDQENANLDVKNTVLAELWDRHVGATQTEVRSALARCGLGQEDMTKLVGELSGGERAKLALCVFESEHGNVLLLDEPTNHLDLVARESLEVALKNFDGTVIFVSHDRYFITAIADHVVEIADQRLTTYEGGYQYYREAKKRVADEQLRAKQEEERQQYEERKQSSYRSKAERAEEAKKKARIKQIEADISSIEEQEEHINMLLADPQITADFTQVNALCLQLQQLKDQQDALYAEYETLL